MKLIFLLAFIGLAASASLRPELELTASTQPKTLIYQYDAQVATGLKEVSDDFSTVRMRFRVAMQKDQVSEGVQSWTVQFQEANIRQRLNATGMQPNILQPMSQFRNLESSEQWFAMEQALKRPFQVKIRAVSQKIEQLSFSKQDSLYSINLKKGFMQTLQLQFQKLDQPLTNNWIKQMDEMTTADECKTSYVARKIYSAEIYDYHLPRMNVEKVIDFNDCSSRLNSSRAQTGMWSGIVNANPLQQMQQQQQKRIVDVSNLANYIVDIFRSSRQPLIRQAAIRTIYTVMPFGNSEHGAHTVTAIQQLELLKASVNSISEEISAEDQQVAPEGLRLLFPKESQQLDRKLLKRRVMQQISQLLKRSDQAIDMQVYEQIVRDLRSFVTEQKDLEAIAEEIQSESSQQSKQLLRAFILEICPQIGSTESVQFLMQVVRDILRNADRRESRVAVEQLTVADIQPIFVKLALTGSVQLEMIQAVFQTVKSDEFRSKLQLQLRLPIFKSGWLCLGAMMNTLYASQAGAEPFIMKSGASRELHFAEDEVKLAESRDQMQRQSNELRSSIVEWIRQQMLADQENDVKVTLALKVLQNAGLFEVYDDLAKIFLQSSDRSIKQRVQAIYATQKLLQRATAQRFYTKAERSDWQHAQHYLMRSSQEIEAQFQNLITRIEQDLIIVFRSVTDDTEVRIACYRVLIQSPISRTTLNSLLQHIISEPSVQVKAYCAEHLRQIAEKALPRYQNVRSAVRAVLPQLERSSKSQTEWYSRLFQGQLWNRLHEAGFSVEADVITSDKAFTPRVSHIRLDHQSLGRNVPLLEITVRTEGLQQLLEKVFGPRGLIYSNKNILLTLNRVARGLLSESDYKYQSFARSSDLHFVTRILKELPNLDITVSMMGNDLLDFEISKNMMKDVKKMSAEDCLRSLSQLKQLLQPLTRAFTVGVSAQLPTPVGTYLDVNALSRFDIRPEIQLTQKAETQEFEQESRSPKTVGKLSVQAQISAPISVQTIQRIGCNMLVLEHFHQFQSELQVNKDNAKVVVKASIETKKDQLPQFSLKHSLPSKSGLTLLQFKSSAKSVIRECRTADPECSSIEKQLHHRSILAPTQIRTKPQFINQLLSAMGVELEVTGSAFSGKDLFQAPCWSLLGAAHFKVTVRQANSEAPEQTMMQYQLNFDTYTSSLRKAAQLTVSQIGASSDFTRTVLRVQLQKVDTESADSAFEAHIQLVNIIHKIQTQYKMQIQVQQPQHLSSKNVQSLPLQSDEWIQERTAQMLVKIEQEGESVMQLRIKLSTNPQLLRLLKENRISQQQMISLFPRLRQCVKEAQKSVASEVNDALLTPSCLRQLREFNQLSHVEIKMENFQQGMQYLKQLIDNQLVQVPAQYLSQLLQLFVVQQQQKDFSMSPRSDVMPSMTMQPSAVDSRVVSVKVSLPWTEQQWTMQLPVQAFFWDGFENITTAASNYIKGGDASCKLLNSHVETFDQVVYSIPQKTLQQSQEANCGVVLARDCSKTRFFAVDSFVNETTKTIVVKLRTGVRNIVLTIDKSLDGSEDKTTFTYGSAVVDSPQKRQPEGTLFDYTEDDFVERQGDQQMTPHSVHKYSYDGSSMYEINVYNLQLQLLIGGPALNFVQVRASPFYNNKICGLCGDYNGDKFHEMKGTDGKRLMRNADQLFREYVEPSSDACRAVKQQAPSSDDSLTKARRTSLINHRRFNPFYMQQDNDQCFIQNYQRPGWKKIKTVTNARVKINPSMFNSLLQDTDCAMTLAETKIGQLRIRVFQKMGEDDFESVQVHIQSLLSYKQEAQQSEEYSRFLTERSEEPLEEFQKMMVFSAKTDEFSGVPSHFGLKSQLQKRSRSNVLTLSNGFQSLSIEAFYDASVVIKATQLTGGVCQWTNQMKPRFSLEQFIEKYTSAPVDSTCAREIRDKTNKCHINQEHVTPFRNTVRSNKQSIRFLNNDLMQITANKRVSIPLSIDRIMGETHNNIITMRDIQEDSKIIREYSMIFGNSKLATIKISQPFSDSDSSVTFLKEDGSVATQSVQGEQEINLANDMKLKISADKIQVVHRSGYGLEVQKRNGLNAMITRPSSLSSHAKGGLCQISRDQNIMRLSHNERHVLGQMMDNSLRAVAATGMTSAIAEDQRELQSVLSLINHEAQN